MVFGGLCWPLTGAVRRLSCRRPWVYTVKLVYWTVVLVVGSSLGYGENCEFDLPYQ